MSWRFASSLIDTSRPCYLGIINLTPDSFSDGGEHASTEAASARAMHLVRRGARILDLGAESTRPGAEPVSEEVEWSRLEPVLNRLHEQLPHTPLSVDTRHPSIAAKALESGASILNDVTGFRNPGMLHLARSSSCGLIAMRSRIHEDFLHMPEYGDPVPASAEKIFDEMDEIKQRIQDSGIAPERVLLDPGFGFGTTFREDESIWNSIREMPGRLDWPVERFCIGLSRKRFVAWHSGNPSLPPRERDAATVQKHRELQASGFNVFRTHEVPDPRIRKAEAPDAPAVARVQVISWQAAYRGILPECLLGGLSIQEREEFCRSLLLSPPSPRHKIWVLERASEIQGFASFGPLPDEASASPEVGEIFAIYLLPEAWRLGFGRQLLLKTLADFKAAGFEEARLWVLERNVRARKFYESMGWSMMGEPRTEWHAGYALREICYRTSPFTWELVSRNTETGAE